MDVLLNQITFISGDYGCTLDILPYQGIEDMAKNWFACNINKHLGQGMRVRPKPGTNTGYWNNCMHEQQKYGAYCSRKRCPTRIISDLLMEGFSFLRAEIEIPVFSEISSNVSPRSTVYDARARGFSLA